MATLTCSLTCPDRTIFPFFCHHWWQKIGKMRTCEATCKGSLGERLAQIVCELARVLALQIITEKAILIISYLVAHHHWINLRKILCWEMHLSFYFWKRIYLLFFWCCHIASMVHPPFYEICKFLCPLISLQGFRLAGWLWLTLMVPFHFKDHEARSGILNSSSLKYSINAIKWRWLMIMHVFSQDKWKIENGSKKTFAIIPKFTKFANVFFHDSQYTVIYIHYKRDLHCSELLQWLKFVLLFIYFVGNFR